MTHSFSYHDFYNELQTDLPTSSTTQRKAWASIIINHNLDIKKLSSLLHGNKKVALRFSWLLTEIGEMNPNKLGLALPYLLELSEQIDHFNFIQSFATYWLISGVPLENESRAIDLLFQWVLSSQINVTTKSRSFKVLVNLTKKYPELKNEISVCLEDQIDKHSKSFEKKAIKLLTDLR